MRRRWMPVSVVVGALALLGAPPPAGSTPGAAVAGAQTVRVVRCPTQFGTTNAPPLTPASIAVLGAPRSVAGLVAYTNTELYLVGPAGMQCSGGVGADGTAQLVVWPHGHALPATHAHYDGLTLSLIPACVGCKAEAACPFFTQYATEEGFPCPTGIPAGERVYGVRAQLTLFSDPPGVAGDGWPSGGPDPANGLWGLLRPHMARCTAPHARSRRRSTRPARSASTT